MNDRGWKWQFHSQGYHFTVRYASIDECLRDRDAAKGLALVDVDNVPRF